MFRIEEIEWSFARIDHIAHHRVEPDEVEAVVYGTAFVTRVRQGRYRLIGQTDAGRWLTVILAPRGSEVFMVVTARDATDVERRAARRR